MTVTFIHSLHIGITIQNILYGIELALYFETISMLLRNRGAYNKSNLLYAFLSSMMVTLISIWVAAHVVFGKNMWLIHSAYPGGALAYWKANLGVWYMDLAATAVIALQLVTDALMIYRCRVIWNSYRAIVVPIALWTVTLILGALVAWLTSSTRSGFFTGTTAHFCLAYWSISVFLNMTLTCMVCYRVVRHGHKVREHLGQEYASLYFAVATVIVESVLPYTLSSIAFLVTLGADSATGPVFVCVYFLTMCLSPQMLILRVVTGKAWRNDALSPPGSTIKFSAGNVSGTRSRWSVGGNPAAVVLISSNTCLPNPSDNTELPV